METCRVDGCERAVKVKARHFCGLHYARWWKHGDPLAWKRPVRRLCSVEGCTLKQVALGLCSKHYTRQKRYGTVEMPERPTICTVLGCGEPVAAWARCERHYRRAKAGVEQDRWCRFCGGLIDPNLHLMRVYCSKECREQELAVQRREEHRGRWLKRYGLTVAQYEDMLLAQDNRCAICRGDDHKGRNWAVDHDHVTGRVRGVLCGDCNKLLGYAKDDTTILEAALTYLR